ncbi:hypothetical protein M4D70_00080 [Brevibacillus borstelensis]|nr:hypothetical protein [Brevibacillus borstelensis]MCM3561524.1 hypothetical protein [Brevibacillus borstelensis]MCM3589580.1 hypothetical protein [Brevibacillus borstelensis]MCM3620660.1 hypothetical protein [Brevibacillus borstelensis]
MVAFGTLVLMLSTSKKK